MKRWLLKHSSHYRPVGVTVLGEDLYGDQPMCLAIREAGFNFILVCLPQSHPTLYEWIDSLSATGQVQTRLEQRWTGK